jgi:broad specificity phosphatase PhoE
MAGLALPSKPTVLHLIRHGEVAGNERDRVYGDMEMDLSPRGVAQLEAMGEELAREPLRAVFASDLERARIGAAAIARPHGLEPRIDRDLREIFRGAWRGLTWGEIEARWPGGPQRFLREPATYRDNDGETLADVDRRAVRAFERIVAIADGGVAAVVSHSWIVRSLIARVLDAPLESAMGLPVDTGSLQTIACDGAAWRLRCFNRRPHGRTPLASPPRESATG